MTASELLHLVAFGIMWNGVNVLVVDRYYYVRWFVRGSRTDYWGLSVSAGWSAWGVVLIRLALHADVAFNQCKQLLPVCLIRSLLFGLNRRHAYLHTDTHTHTLSSPFMSVLLASMSPAPCMSWRRTQKHQQPSKYHRYLDASRNVPSSHYNCWWVVLDLNVSRSYVQNAAGTYDCDVICQSNNCMWPVHTDDYCAWPVYQCVCAMQPTAAWPSCKLMCNNESYMKTVKAKHQCYYWLTDNFVDA